MSAKGEHEKKVENTVKLEIKEESEENNNEVEVSNDDEGCVSIINKPLHNLYSLLFLFL